MSVNGPLALQRSSAAGRTRWRESFLPLVSPVARKTRPKEMTRKHPYVKRYAGTYLKQKTTYRPLTFITHGMDQPQYVSDGMVRAAILSMPVSDLRMAIAYMLEHDDPTAGRPTMLAHPENFERFEELRDDTALRHEVLKEPADVLWDLYALSGRVGYRGNARGSGRVRGEVADALGYDLDGAVQERVAKATHLSKLPYEREARPAKNDGPRGIYFRAVNPDDPLPLFANLGQPANDPRVFVTEPTGSILGTKVGNPDRVHGLCDVDMDRLFARTADLDQRSGMNELSNAYPLRDAIALARRAACPVNARTVQHIVERTRQNRPATAYDDLDDEDLRQLYQSGLSREQIARVWARS